MNMTPSKLKIGDEIRVIAPSRSLGIISEENIKYALQALKAIGLNVTFSKHASEIDMFMSSSVESRIGDLHEAFADSKVKGILTVLGGYNSNQLLDHIDYDLIANNPKILSGFSDITALSNAIYANARLVSYSGPHFSTFAMQKGLEYTLEYFKKALFTNEEISVISSKQWSSDGAWYLNQENRSFYENPGIVVINSGTAAGKILGGNLGTFQLLRGTPYMPSLEGSVLFLEEVASFSDDTGIFEFDRNLQSLTQSPDFDGVQAIVFGRFETSFKMTMEKFHYIIETKPKLKNIPIICDVDFGHSTPIITFPIGGWCNLCTNLDGNIELSISDRH
jgi:muramoyltetrapeptide carboxypeptidase LdcA involved in peptidoglycan recycling